MFAGIFEVPAWLLAWFYQLTSSYVLAISLIAVVVMALITPLTLKSTKGMLEMQRLAPQMRRLQNEHRNDRQMLNQEMMTLYQEHKVNPLASCFQLLLQMPVFIIMFRPARPDVPLERRLRPDGPRDLRRRRCPTAELGFCPLHLADSTCQSLVGRPRCAVRPHLV